MAVVGNGAALSFGPQVIAPMADEAGFPFLAANLLFENGDRVPGCIPSMALEIAGVRIGLIGMAPRWEYWTWFGLQNPESAPIVRAQVKALREAGCTVMILLSHLGVADDAQLAGPVRGLDLIIGGHSHTTIFGGLEQTGVLVTQAGDYGRFLGRVDLTIDDSGAVVERSATLIPLDNSVDPDPAVVQEMVAQRALVAKLLAEPVGETSAALPFDPLAESSLANLLADATRLRCDADVALVQPTHLLGSLPAGTVTLGDVYDVCMSPGNPAVRLLTGAQLLEMIEVGLDPARARELAPWGRSRPNGLIALSGITVRLDPNAPAGARLVETLIDGEPVDPGRV